MFSHRLCLFTCCFVLAFVPPISGATIVQNGSLEDLNGSFVNTAANYMQLPAGSTAIAGWTVAATTVNNIAWGKTPTGDSPSVSASQGTYFVDLTGFGSESPNGAIQQTLHNLIVGQNYSFSMDTLVNGILPTVMVGAQTVSLTPGVPFLVGTTTWTPETGSFIAGGTDPLLSISNALPGQDIDFIDNINITGPTTAVPEPSGLVLACSALVAFGVVGRRKKGLTARVDNQRIVSRCDVNA
jgi:hypothetical protein